MKQIRLKNETLKIIDPKSLKEFLKFLEAEKKIELLKEGRNWEWDEEMQEEIQDPPYDPLTDEELNRLIEEFQIAALEHNTAAKARMEKEREIKVK